MHGHSPLRRSRQCGAVLIPIIIFMLLIGGLSLSLLIEAEGGVIFVRHQETSIRALEIAEMGVVQAELEIRGQRDGATDGIGNVSGEYAGGRYEVTAVPDPLLEGRWLITATGVHTHSTRRIQVGVRRRANGRAVEGLYAKEELTFGGNSTTDAYDSGLGTYATQALNDDAGGSFAALGGDIGSGMGIRILGSGAHVRGNAVPGPGFATEVSGGATVLGDRLPRLTMVDLQPAPYAEFYAAYTSNQNDTLSGAYATTETEGTVVGLTDGDLVGLTDTEVEGFKRAEMLTLTDTQVSSLTFGELLADSYPALVTTVDTVLLAYSKEEYEKALLDSSITYTHVVAMDSDEYALYGGTAPTNEIYEAPTTTKSVSAAKTIGRLSYNATTRELRATAGAEIVLQGGTYFFSDLRLVGNSSLVVRGPSKIYVTGRLDLGGGSIVNETGKASNLKIFAHPYALPPAHPPSSSLVKVRGGAAIAASIYAPEVDVTIGGGDNFFGSVVGRRISLLGGVRYHYDLALRDVDLQTGASLERLFWREVNQPRR